MPTQFPDAFPLAVTDPTGDLAASTTTYLNADARSGTASNGKVSFTIDQAANDITGGQPGWSHAFGAPATVTYAYRADAPYAMPSDTGGFQQFNQVEIDQTELALKAWSDVANIHFVRVGAGDVGPAAYSDNATILLGGYSTGEAGSAAFTFFPGSTSAASNSGDVWVNVSLGYNRTPTVGNYGGQVLIHELGHAIGLDHPSPYNAGAGVSITYSADATYFEDSRQYTVMSYFSETNTGGYFGGTYSAAPLVDDIAAVQLEYGPNMTTRTGDTVYGFHSTTGEPWNSIASSSAKAVFAIWDAGGNDTLDLSGYGQAQHIDLRQGFFSDVGGLTGNVAIAKGADIENAVGGFGADTITGNALGNSIMAGAGDDEITAGNGRNYLRGEDGNDTISGGTGFDDINGNAGNDTAHGNAGDDWVVGGKDQDQLYGDAGNDIVWGNLGADTLDGGDGNDQVRGGQGDDSVSGGAGDDYVSGDRGNDTISGGAGADLFHTSQDAGVDRVIDFHASEGDRVMLDQGTTYTVSQVGADTVIDMGAGNEMILVGVQLSTLPAGWIFEG